MAHQLGCVLPSVQGALALTEIFKAVIYLDVTVNNCALLHTSVIRSMVVVQIALVKETRNCNCFTEIDCVSCKRNPEVLLFY